ncbi:hypothetical protein [Anaeromyxobacter sp. Fw109-5]|uniref:hypothetical protein n=1 Tax=Anaeromyxobacter sp. (strain Fw109-5) TaxID=404589 RepID=UPI0000ED8199|nr:hypothetical protein [Anaeromyxobacter sp. Fw109-5]ABS26101.1 putative lipoprotein [Anaeromyxobacter sp. Fw109-5]
MRKLLALIAALSGLACSTPRQARPTASSPASSGRPFTSEPAGAPTGTPQDQDGDGRTDAWVTRGADGAISRLAYDLDRDGEPDVVLVFEGGALARKELVHRVEGVPPTWSVFEGGELVRKERDTDGDGRPDVWERYARGSLVSVERDTDRDGRPDGVEAGAPER